MKIKKIVVALFVLAFLPQITFAKSEKHKELEALLTDALSSKEGLVWTLEVWIERLGGDVACVSGIEWIFYVDGSLKKKECDDGKVNQTNHDWSLSINSLGKSVLVIDGRNYWVEILKEQIVEEGLPPYEMLIAKIQEERNIQEESVQLIELSRVNE